MRGLLGVCMIGLPAGLGIWLGQALMYGDGEDLFTRDTTRTWNQALEAGGVLVGDEVAINLEIQATQAKSEEAAAE